MENEKSTEYDNKIYLSFPWTVAAAGHSSWNNREDGGAETDPGSLRSAPSGTMKYLLSFSRNAVEKLDFEGKIRRHSCFSNDPSELQPRYLTLKSLDR